MGQPMHGDVFLLVEPAGRRSCVVERRACAAANDILERQGRCYRHLTWR